MRILFFGNQGNIGYRICKWFRKKGIDATLFVPKSGRHSRSLPEWEDPSLKGNYPHWIKTFKESKSITYYPDNKVVTKSKDCDIVLTTGEVVISALCLSKPVVYIPVGYDITELPFMASSLKTKWRSYLYKKRITRVCRILTPQEDCLWAARFLKASDQIYRLSFPVDCKSIAEGVDKNLYLELTEKYSKFKFVFLNLCRKNIDPNNFSYKGNEKFLSAFGRLVQKQPNLNIKVILGMHGHHCKEFIEMIDESGISNNCDFVEHLPLDRLHAYLSLNNAVVFDQFGPCARISLGGISREALALGTPLVINTEKKSFEFENTYGPDCPLIPAFTVDEIYDSMKTINVLTKEQFRQLKDNSRKWALKYLDWENWIDALLLVLDEVIKEQES